MFHSSGKDLGEQEDESLLLGLCFSSSITVQHHFSLLSLTVSYLRASLMTTVMQAVIS